MNLRPLLTTVSALVVLAAVPGAASTTTGRVVWTDGLPAAGATISAYWPEGDLERARRLAAGLPRSPRAEVVSDAEGRFRFDLPSGEGPEVIEVVIDLEGAAPWSTELLAGEALGAALLQRAPMRDGRLTLSGVPRPGARVVWRDRKGQPRWVTETDSRGRYRVPDPATWASTVAILDPIVGVRDEAGGFDPQVIWNEFTEGGGSTAPQADLELAEGRRLRGRVVDADGAVADAEIWVSGWPAATSDPQGRFTVTLGDRPTVVQARLGNQIAQARVESGESVTLELLPARAVRGRLSDRHGAGIAGATVQLHARESTGRDGRFASTRRLVTDREGRFETLALPWITTLWTQAPGYSIDDNSRQFDLRRSEAESTRFVATPQARIEGFVRDSEGKPLAGAWVFPNWGGEQLMYGLPAGFERVPESDADGRFDLPAGDSASGTHEPEWTVWRDGWAPTILRPEAEETEVRLTPGVAATVYVEDSAGEPISEATVAIVEGAPSWATASTLASRDLGLRWFFQTDEQGTRHLRLRPGPHHLGVAAPGYAPAGVELWRLARGTAGELHVVLEESAAIGGHVVFADGNPLPGAMVMISGDEHDRRATTDSRGGFEVTDLPAGTYSLQLHASGALPVARRRVSAPSQDLLITVDRGYSVRGVVLEEGSFRPISGAQVVSLPVGTTNRISRSATTDDQGRFELEVLPEGRLLVSAQADGFVSGKSSELSVGPQGPSAEVEIQLTAGSTLVGQISDESGTPILAASISVLEAADLDWPAALSDQDGSFRLEGLPRGPHRIQVQADGFVTRQFPVELDRSEHAMDVVLSRGDVLVGRAVDETGSPLSQMHVRASAQEYFGSDLVEEDGSFEISGLPEGQLWEVTGYKNQYGSETLTEVDPQAGPFELRLRRLPTGTVFGAIRGASAEQLANLQVSVQGSGTAVTTQVAADGSFETDEAPAGDVTVKLYGHRRSESISESRSALVPEREAIRVDFDLSQRIPVEGWVTRGGEPEMGVSVRLKGVRGAHDTTARTSSEGYFKTSVPAGPHDVSVRSSSGSPYRRRLEIQQPTVLQIELQGVELRGRVVDAWTGEGIPDTTVELITAQRVDGSAASRFGSVETGADGSFSLPEAPAGLLLVRATHPDFAARLIELDLPPGDSTPLEIALEPTPGLVVELVDAGTGARLQGPIVVRDLQNRVLWNGSPSPHEEGFRIPLGEGRYKVSASATGYASLTVRAQSPTPDTVRIGLTPGGTAVIHSETLDRRVARLIAPDGEEYVQCWCNQISAFAVQGSRTELRHIAPGSYTLSLEELDGRLSQYALEVVEGETVEIAVH